MYSKHAYGSDARNKLKTFGYLALVSVVLTHLTLTGVDAILSYPVFQGVKQSFPVNSITLTTVFGIVFFLYDRWLWNWVGNTPKLSGTWVGLVVPNYQLDRPHLEFVWIEQTWTEMFVFGEVVFKRELNDAWNLNIVLGTYHSVAAGVTDVAAGTAVLTVCYGHIGQVRKQPDFRGALMLHYNHRSKKMRGKYFTNRVDDDGGHEGSLGPVWIVRVSTSILTKEEAFKVATDLGILTEMEPEIIRAAQLEAKRKAPDMKSNADL